MDIARAEPRRSRKEIDIRAKLRHKLQHIMFNAVKILKGSLLEPQINVCNRIVNGCGKANILRLDFGVLCHDITQCIRKKIVISPWSIFLSRLIGRLHSSLLNVRHSQFPPCAD